MTKHRLMLSAAAAALLAGPLLVSAARADTEISNGNKTAQTTATDGNITIDSGGSVTIKSAGAAVTLNSANTLLNYGTISNANTTSAVGVLVDTTGGNVISTAAGLTNLGNIDLSGTGTTKTGVAISGGNIFFGDTVISSLGATTTTSSSGTSTTTGTSSIAVAGDSSVAFQLVQGTTVDGNIQLGGSIGMTPAKNSTAAGATLIDLEGGINGNLIFDSTSVFSNVGSSSRGVLITGPIATCDATALAGVGKTCATGVSGVFINAGTISVTGTTTPNTKGGNLESGSAVVIANSIAGGFVNEGPATAAGSVAVAVIAANGAVTTSSAQPAFVIDPGQSVTTTQTTVRGPAIIGPVTAASDSIDPGYSFINRGTIQAVPIDLNVSSSAVVIQGSSAVNFTCLGVLNAAGTGCSNSQTTGGTTSTTTATSANGTVTTTVTTTTGGTTQIVGGLLNTGTITARAVTSVNTESLVAANAFTVGTYATIPRIVVSGELTSGNSYTRGTIAAQVSGPGGGTATSVAIASLAVVPEIDVLQHGSITASITTSTLSPTTVFATAQTPFTQAATAIVDQSGTLQTINNAGLIAAVTTVQTPAAGSVVSNTAQAINLLAGTAGGATVNNSGQIEGDIYFGAGGSGNTLNVGNTGAGGTANTAVAAVQTTAVTNTPYAYASVSGTISATNSGAPPTALSNLISFGSGTGNVLHVGGFGYVNSTILAASGGLDVTVDNNGQLYIANTAATGSLNARNFDINGGVVGLTISQGSSGTLPVVLATKEATIAPAAAVGLQFGSFIASGVTASNGTITYSAASVAQPTPQVITLISAPTLNLSSTTLAADNTALAQNIPFLFQPTSTPLSRGTLSGNQTLLLTLTPKTPAQLGLAGDATALFPSAVQALANDPTLGAAIATGVTNSQTAQQVFSQFAPDVSGGARAVAILITDQATGPVAARQRLLRSYGNDTGELTLWSTQFGAMINNKAKADADGTLTDYKDHGFGFSLGMDAGSARGGWYGGALSFYSGDVIETLPRASKTNTEWYMLTGYTDWRGKHVFLDTQASVAYGKLDGNRSLVIGNQSRDAVGKRGGLIGALGATTGVFFNFGGAQVIPHISLDGLALREEGYTESGGGDGLDLQVQPYYAESLRTFLGVDLKDKFPIFDVDFSPEARVGYRYDFINNPVKLKAGFDSVIRNNGLAGNTFTFVGPDPDSGNFLAGFSLGTGTDTWQLGVNYDWIRGNNNSTSQIGTVSLLGRI